MKFRKKPVEIDAIQYTGKNIEEIEDFVGKSLNFKFLYNLSLVLPTLEGDHEARVGDWIIKGIKGEFYPCKPDIFEQTYDKVI